MIADVISAALFPIASVSSLSPKSALGSGNNTTGVDRHTSGSALQFHTLMQTADSRDDKPSKSRKKDQTADLPAESPDTTQVKESTPPRLWSLPAAQVTTTVQEAVSPNHEPIRQTTDGVESKPSSAVDASSTLTVEGIYRSQTTALLKSVPALPISAPSANKSERSVAVSRFQTIPSRVPLTCDGQGQDPPKGQPLTQDLQSSVTLAAPSAHPNPGAPAPAGPNLSQSEGREKSPALPASQSEDGGSVTRVSTQSGPAIQQALSGPGATAAAFEVRLRPIESNKSPETSQQVATGQRSSARSDAGVPAKVQSQPESDVPSPNPILAPPRLSKSLPQLLSSTPDREGAKSSSDSGETPSHGGAAVKVPETQKLAAGRPDSKPDQSDAESVGPAKPARNSSGGADENHAHQSLQPMSATSAESHTTAHPESAPDSAPAAAIDSAPAANLQRSESANSAPAPRPQAAADEMAIPPQTPAPAGASPAGIKIAIDDNGQRVELRVTERAGDIHVAVRTPDTQLASAMHEQLPSLSSKLEQSGFRTEVWRPAAPAGGDSKHLENSGQPGSDARQSSGERRQQQDGQQGEKNTRQTANRKTERKEFSWLLESIR